MTDELGWTLDLDPGSSGPLEIAGVTRDESLRISSNADLEEREVSFVRQLDVERQRCHSYALCFDMVEDIRDVAGIESELWPTKHGPVFSEDPVVDEERHLSREEQVESAARIPAWVQKSGDEHVRIENDSQAGRRRRRTSRTSRLIWAMELRSVPVSAAFRRMRDTARMALALRMASTVSSNRVSSTPTRTPMGLPFAVRTTSPFESVDQTRPGRLRSSRMLTYFMGRV